MCYQDFFGVMELKSQESFSENPNLWLQYCYVKNMYLEIIPCTADLDMTSFENSVDSDQLASNEAI